MPIFGLLCLFLTSARAFAAALPVPDGNVHQFALHDGKFWIDTQPLRIVAGEIHPQRIPYQLWEDRIKKAKAMGLNTVSVYFFWNQIEPAEGNFNFEGENDVKRFVQLCQENGLWVALRPGPYVCAEIEFGGFPAWLLKHKDMKIRADDPKFLAYCKSYVEKIHEQLGALQVNHGGPILMVQMENELSAINPYLNHLHDIFVSAGWDTQLFTCDHSGNVWNQIQGIPGVLRAYNGMANGGEGRVTQLTAVVKPTGYPMYSPEIYTAWFSKWGEPLAKKNIPTQLKDSQWLLDHKDISFCYYVFDGGTNLGFSAGSNSRDPVQTSYDYDAPVDELGRVTPKFRAMRDLLIKETGVNPPAIPADPKVIQIPPFSLTLEGAMLHYLPANPTSSDDVLTMEDIDQNYGFVLYRKKFDAGVKGKLDLGRAVDYTWVMIDGKVVGENFVKFSPAPSIVLNHDGACTMDILVHNLGRTSSPWNTVNVGFDRKGLQEDPKLDGKSIQGWQIYSLPMDDPTSIINRDEVSRIRPETTGPTMYQGTFNITEPGETYLDMRNWHFGVVWVNGHNLGRFWEVGGGRSLYLPSCWQTKGENQIVILELGPTPKKATVQGVTNMIEETPKPFAPLWK
jgi:beta-galactosidase